MNAEGFKFYDREFSHTFVTQILTNPAYAGHTHFGKTKTGELHSFDKDGLVVKRSKPQKGKRAESERIIVENTYVPLIDAETWKLAQEKFAAEQDRTSYSPPQSRLLSQTVVCLRTLRKRAFRKNGEMSQHREEESHLWLLNLREGTLQRASRPLWISADHA